MTLTPADLRESVRHCRSHLDDLVQCQEWDRAHAEGNEPPEPFRASPFLEAWLPRLPDYVEDPAVRNRAVLIIWSNPDHGS